MELCDGQLKLYSSVTATAVDWLWYPYIPFGKITLLQGDPGCGKSTLMMNIISAISTGSYAPDGMRIKKPMHVIYQCSEDGAGDTIKPRLNAAGANCRNVAFLDEETDSLTLADEKIRRAIADFNAKLLVIDPVQAYLGDADLSNAVGMRKMLRQLNIWASLYDCAIVLVGHLNKRMGIKDLYRSLGSIDLIAAARSVIQISSEDDSMILHHLKSSLAPKGCDKRFIIDSQRCIHWIEQDGPCIQNDEESPVARMNKHAQTAKVLKAMLESSPIKAAEVQAHFSQLNISERTLMDVKKELGIRSIKKDNVWYWQLPIDLARREVI